MDAQALIELHATLQAQGFAGQLEPLRALLKQAEANTTERRVLAWWKGLNAHRQHAALAAVFGHARKHEMTISTFERADQVTLVLSRSRGFRGVFLGRVDVDTRGVHWHFYRGTCIVGDRSVQL